MERPNIRSIARVAGVSKTTVSRVLNEKAEVSAETRAKVERVIKELSYTPHQAALALATGRNGLVGLSVYGIRGSFLLTLLEGVDEAQKEHDLDIVLYLAPQPERRQRLVQRAIDSGLLSGLVCILPGTESRFLEERFQAGFPVVVLLGFHGVSMNLPCVGIDNRRAAEMATDHLLDLGHRRIAILVGDTDIGHEMDRLNGYKDALRERQIAFDPALVRIEDSSEVTGYEGALVLLTGPNPPSAVFATSDFAALGVLRAATKLGISVPDRLAVVGFDDIPQAATFRPALTTMRQPTAELGRMAVRLIMQQIADGTTSACDAVLPTELIVRESCGANTEAPVGWSGKSLSSEREVQVRS